MRRLRPKNLIFGLQELNLSGEFLAGRARQRIHERLKDLRRRDTIGRNGIFRDDKVFYPAGTHPAFNFWGWCRKSKSNAF
jgi:hypothetical protein